MKQIAVLTGGESSERAIALLSAKTVEKALSSYYHVRVFDFPRDLNAFLACRTDFVAVVPVFHGRGGEDGQVQGFLRTIGIPFIFSDIEAHAVAINKALTKQRVEHAGVKTPTWQVAQSISEVILCPPIVIKPIHEGSSIGVRICQKLEGETWEHEVLVESLIVGREFTVGVIGNGQPLPVIEIRSTHTFFDFESKYDPHLAEEICPAQIDQRLADRLQEIAVAVHRLIGIRHLSRSDFLVDVNGEIWFLEINTIPGLTEASLVPKAIRAAGLDLGELLNEWIQEVI